MSDKPAVDVSAGTKKVGRPTNPDLVSRRKRQILTKSAEIFAAQGYRQTDVQTIADQLNIGKGTIYRYFPSKKLLFLSVVDHGMRGLLKTVEHDMEAFTDPLMRVARAVLSYLTYFDRNPALVELLIQERAEFRNREKPTYFLHQASRLERWHQAMRNLINKGLAREMAVDTMFDTLSNLLYGTMFTNFFKGREKSVAQQAQDILDIFFNGILIKPFNPEVLLRFEEDP